MFKLFTCPVAACRMAAMRPVTLGFAGSAGTDATALSDFEKGLSDARLGAVVHPVDSRETSPTEQAATANRWPE